MSNILNFSVTEGLSFFFIYLIIHFSSDNIITPLLSHVLSIEKIINFDFDADYKNIDIFTTW